jgi:hypothetical protein
MFQWEFVVRSLDTAAFFMPLMVCMDIFGQIIQPITAAQEAGATVWKNERATIGRTVREVRFTAGSAKQVPTIQVVYANSERDAPLTS